MTKEHNIILNTVQIHQRIRRIAYQIYESNSDEKEVVIAGVIGNGYIFAEKLVAVLSEISDIKVRICLVTIDKKNPLNPITTSLSVDEYANKSLVLVDDVLNSGVTLSAALREVLNHSPKSIRTAVLANRDHHKFPIQANYVGISLATTLQENISYQVTDDQMSVWLG